MTWRQVMKKIVPRALRTPAHRNTWQRFVRKIMPRAWGTALVRAFQAAEVTNLNAGWKTTPTAINAELRTSLRPMVARSRQAEQDNDYAKKFINMMAANVVGPGGIKMQSKIRFSSGRLQKRSNKVIERGWKKFAKRVDVTRKLSWVAFLRQVIKTAARDGEVLIRLVRGFDNEAGFAVQVIEADRLDIERNELFRDGRRIVMGVELNVWGEPIAYHVLTAHPGDSFVASVARRHTERILADEILHFFLMDRPEQARGIPWMHTALWRFNMVKGYEEAEMVASRLGASKMGFLTSESGTPVAADTMDPNKLSFEVEPGQWRPLPPGVKFDSWDPQHPNASYHDFMKTALRGGASGCLVNYNSLANDLEGVNFSSLRQGALDERDMYRMIQGEVIDQVCQPIGEAWVTMQALQQTLPIPGENLDRVVEGLSWQPRGWQWVDPMKEAQANILAKNNKLLSHRRILAAQGLDFEDVLDELEEEQEMIEERGLLDESGQSVNVPVQTEEKDEETVS